MNMNLIERRLLKRTILLGACLTLLVQLLSIVGALDPLERYLYDIRARHGQRFAPPPTDRIFHLDIDDAALQEIGKWPWPREQQALIIDEIAKAKPAILAMDIIYPESSKVELTDDGSVRLDPDAALAASLKRLGVALLPATVDFEVDDPDQALRDAMTQVLMENAEMQATELTAKLVAAGHKPEGLDARVKGEFLLARDEAILRLVDRELEEGPADIERLWAKITPRAYAESQLTDARLVVRKTLPIAQSLRILHRYGQAIPASLTGLLRGNARQLTIAVLLQEAKFSAIVDFLQAADGVVRYVPLAAEVRGRLIPHMSLVTAATALGVPVQDIRFENDRIILPLPEPGKTLEIPVHTLQSDKRGRVSLFLDVPWVGTANWLTMYGEGPAQHMSLQDVWKIIEFQRQIDRNLDLAREPVGYLTEISQSPDSAANLLMHWRDLDHAAREQEIQKLLSEPNLAEVFKQASEMKPEDRDADSKQFLLNYGALQNVIQLNARTRENMGHARQTLKQRLEGKVVYMGMAATGLLDAWTTSLHPSCPGVIIQSQITNGILTGQLLRRSPAWVGVALILAIGMLTTLIVAWFSPWVALALSTVLTLGYESLNIFLFYDYGNRVVPQAGAVTVAALCWSGLTLARFIFEAAERSRITSRFRSYVDPALVNYVIEHPEAAGFAGQVREMTVVFTDLAGFTTISEKLRERTVPMLNAYMSLMLPIIRQNRGYWNKFLGDGIMFFFNAPLENPNFAQDAVHTVLQMQNAMEGFNRTLAEQGLPNCSMRAGISTGTMVVGDAGSIDAVHRASDYTVLGDEVNLGARLESANKALGTRILMNERTAELLGSRFLLRPMGIIRVVGKTEGVLTYEALAISSEATDEQRQLASMTRDVVQHYRDASFQRCIEVAQLMEQRFGPAKFTQLYIELSQKYLHEPADGSFDGQIVLVEK